MSAALEVAAHISSVEQQCSEVEGRPRSMVRLVGTPGGALATLSCGTPHISSHMTPGCLRLSPVSLSYLIPLSMALLTPDSCPARCHHVLLLFLTACLRHWPTVKGLEVRGELKTSVGPGCHPGCSHGCQLMQGGVTCVARWPPVWGGMCLLGVKCPKDALLRRLCILPKPHVYLLKCN